MISRATPFVDGIAVVTHLLRTGLPPLRDGLTEVKVFEDMPDYMADKLPMVQFHRTGGASVRPRFYDQFWLPFQVWSDAEPGPGWDPNRAAWELGRQVSTVLFVAWEQQLVTPYGCINHWRESQGFRKLTDPELPNSGRYVATYDLRIRNPRP